MFWSFGVLEFWNLPSYLVSKFKENHGHSANQITTSNFFPRQSDVIKSRVRPTNHIEQLCPIKWHQICHKCQIIQFDHAKSWQQLGTKWARTQRMLPNIFATHRTLSPICALKHQHKVLQASLQNLGSCTPCSTRSQSHPSPCRSSAGAAFSQASVPMAWPHRMANESLGVRVRVSSESETAIADCSNWQFQLAIWLTWHEAIKHYWKFGKRASEQSDCDRLTNFNFEISFSLWTH